MLTIKRVVLPVKCRTPRSWKGLAWLLVTGCTASLFWAGSAPGENLLPPRETIHDLRLGQFFSGGIRVRAPFLGISFIVPPDWRARLGQGSRVLHLDSARMPGIGLVHFLTDMSPEEVEARLNEPLAFEASFVLHPTGPSRREGARVAASYLFGETVGRAVALLGPARQAVVYLFAGPKSEEDHYALLLDHLAASTQFADLATASTLRTWYERLSGVMLTPRSPESSGEVPSPLLIQEWHLCHDGRFFHQVQEDSRTKEGPGGPEPERPGEKGYLETGAWRIDAAGAEAHLVVTPQHGLPRSLALREEGETTFLEGVAVVGRVSDRCL